MLRVCSLKTELLDEPLGIELARPRLSWRLESDRPGARQSAYRVRVASSPEALAAGGADLWDSGKVVSDACFDIAYAGAPPEIRRRCWWTVEVWDETGAQAEPAPPRDLGDGPARPGRLERRVAGGRDRGGPRRPRGGPRGGSGATTDGEADPRRFRLTFVLDASAEATLFVGARGRIDGLDLDGAPLEREPPNPHAFGSLGVQELALGELAAGEHMLAAEIAATPNPARSTPVQRRLRRAAEAARRGRRGPPSRHRPDWETSADGETWAASAPAAHPPRQGLAADRRDAAAQGLRGRPSRWSARGSMRPRWAPTRRSSTARGSATRCWRRRAPTSASACSTASTTSPSCVRAGANVLGAHVGDGWYASFVAPGGRYAFGPPPRRFLAQLELTFADGSRQVVATGDGWRIGALAGAGLGDLQRRDLGRAPRAAGLERAGVRRVGVGAGAHRRPRRPASWSPRPRRRSASPRR